jgi:ubiquinone/menaquinone biosynthesis C-methylase UbiE
LKINTVFEAIYKTIAPRHFKQYRELVYWKSRKKTETVLVNDHYEYFYTDYFGMPRSFYQDKRILDIGCGPRGSLEWADMAAERVGLDPLAGSYLKLGADQHKMQYVAAPAEAIPFPDGYFDVVCSFNSLDHVDNLQEVIAEIKRVVKPGGLFLLIVEANHPPMVTEPVRFRWQDTALFEDAFDIASLHCYEDSDSIYEQILGGPIFDEANKTDRPGILTVRFIRKNY